MTKEIQEALFDISTVARLTGLSTANIRMWEKRHDVVTPDRTDSGRRLYTDEDVRRLTLLKSLCEHGHPIRSTALLDSEKLEDLLRHAKADASPDQDHESDSSQGGRCRVGLIGHHLVSILSTEETALVGTTTVAEFGDLESAEIGAFPTRLDLIIVECPAFFSDTAERVRRLIDRTGALRAVVVYYYSQHQTIELLENSLSRITAIRAPVSPAELKLVCAADIALANRPKGSSLHWELPSKDLETIPERCFSDKQIARLSVVSSAIECECPQHLASLLSFLVSFEQYSRECKNRNAADAKIHAYLHKSTAHARWVIEDALRVLIQFEGIELDDESTAI